MRATRALHPVLLAALCSSVCAFVPSKPAVSARSFSHGARMAAAAAPLVTLAEVKAAAARIGCDLKVSAVGPAYRIELNWAEGAATPVPAWAAAIGRTDDDGAPPPELLGYSDGFTQPTGCVHLESIQVRSFSGYWARRSRRNASRDASRYEVAPRTAGMLVCLGVASWVREEGPFGCGKMQLLAVRDDERQYRTLVRYYRRLGFKPLREVGDGIMSIGDRVAWGGDGMLMEMGVEDYLRRHGPKLVAGSAVGG